MSGPKRVPGPLVIVASLLVISALVRLPFLATEALALDNSPVAAPVEPGRTAQLDALLAELDAREAAVKAREAQIADRSDQLASLEKSVEQKIAELNRAEVELRDLLAIADTAAEDDVSRLTTVYENMKPKDAAGVFEKMPPAFASGFLSRMRPDAAAAIMAGLAPETAYAISVVLAGRHVEAKAND